MRRPADLRQPSPDLTFRSRELSIERRQRAVRALESWLVRRMMLGATTQHYNRLLAALLTRLHEQQDLTTADVTIVEVLSSGFQIGELCGTRARAPLPTPHNRKLKSAAVNQVARRPWLRGEVLCSQPASD